MSESSRDASGAIKNHYYVLSFDGLAIRCYVKKCGCSISGGIRLSHLVGEGV